MRPLCFTNLDVPEGSTQKVTANECRKIDDPQIYRRNLVRSRLGQLQDTFLQQQRRM
jgi:hypothetical protein